MVIVGRPEQTELLDQDDAVHPLRRTMTAEEPEHGRAERGLGC